MDNSNRPRKRWAELSVEELIEAYRLELDYLNEQQRKLTEYINDFHRRRNYREAQRANQYQQGPNGYADVKEEIDHSSEWADFWAREQQRTRSQPNMAFAGMAPNMPPQNVVANGAENPGRVANSSEANEAHMKQYAAVMGTMGQYGERPMIKGSPIPVFRGGAALGQNPFGDLLAAQTHTNYQAATNQQNSAGYAIQQPAIDPRKPGGSSEGTSGVSSANSSSFSSPSTAEQQEEIHYENTMKNFFELGRRAVEFAELPTEAIEEFCGAAKPGGNANQAAPKRPSVVSRRQGGNTTQNQRPRGSNGNGAPRQAQLGTPSVAQGAQVDLTTQRAPTPVAVPVPVKKSITLKEVEQKMYAEQVANPAMRRYLNPMNPPQQFWRPYTPQLLAQQNQNFLMNAYNPMAALQNCQQRFLAAQQAQRMYLMHNQMRNVARFQPPIPRYFYPPTIASNTPGTPVPQMQYFYPAQPTATATSAAVAREEDAASSSEEPGNSRYVKRRAADQSNFEEKRHCGNQQTSTAREVGIGAEGPPGMNNDDTDDIIQYQPRVQAYRNEDVIVVKSDDEVVNFSSTEEEYEDEGEEEADDEGADGDDSSELSDDVFISEERSFEMLVAGHGETNCQSPPPCPWTSTIVDPKKDGPAKEKKLAMSLKRPDPPLAPALKPARATCIPNFSNVPLKGILKKKKYPEDISLSEFDSICLDFVEGHQRKIREKNAEKQNNMESSGVFDMAELEKTIRYVKSNIKSSLRAPRKLSLIDSQSEKSVRKFSQRKLSLLPERNTPLPLNLSTRPKPILRFPSPPPLPDPRRLQPLGCSFSISLPKSTPIPRASRPQPTREAAYPPLLTRADIEQLKTCRLDPSAEEDINASLPRVLYDAGIRLYQAEGDEERFFAVAHYWKPHDLAALEKLEKKCLNCSCAGCNGAKKDAVKIDVEEGDENININIKIKRNVQKKAEGE